MKETHKVVNILERKVALSRRITNASYYLTANEMKIVYIALAKINQHKEGNLVGDTSITVEEFATVCGDINGMDMLVPLRRKDNAKRELDLAIKKLYGRTIKISAGEEYRWIGFFKDTSKSAGETIEFSWNTKIIPYLEDLREYANVFLQNAIGLNKAYTFRFLHLLSQDKSNGRTEGAVYYSFEDIKIMFQLPESYCEFSAFNRAVMKPCLAELLSKRIMEVKVSYRKEGKIVVGINFEWHLLIRGQQISRNALKPMEKI
jgi:plasmid replication initiation protein